MMGLTYANIKLSNPKRPHLKEMEVKALVDTGAMFTCVPEHVVIQLELEKLENREVTTADGKKHIVPYVGPLKIEFDNRSCYAGALVIGNEVLLGAIQMEDMDLIVHPLKNKLMVNPESPNIPSGILK
jgi:clan AA aspartic protease